MEEHPYLPREIVCHVASFVSPDRLNVLFATCRSWRQWLEEAGIWEPALEARLRCPWGQLAPPQLKRLFPAIGAPRFDGQWGPCSPSQIRKSLILKGERSLFLRTLGCHHRCAAAPSEWSVKRVSFNCFISDDGQLQFELGVNTLYNAEGRVLFRAELRWPGKHLSCTLCGVSAYER